MESEAAIAARHKLEVGGGHEEENGAKKRIKALEQILLLYRKEVKAAEAEARGARGEADKVVEPIKFENLRL